MTTPPNTLPEPLLNTQAVAAVQMPAARLLYWSVRRELWENRSLYIAPLIAAGLAMLGFFISLARLPRSVRLPSMDPGHQFIMLVMPYGHTAWLLLLTAFLVGVFYSLDALHGERRDRSILFWKSLPVSDLTTVLSKASIPLVVLPVLVFVITVVTQLVMLLLSTAVLLLSGLNPIALWRQVPLFQMELVLLYGLAVLALGQAPLYAWLLMVSGWARRTVFLWAVLPLLAICVVEKLVFNTTYFIAVLGNRLIGGSSDAFSFITPSGAPVDPHFIPLSQITPGRFLSNPDLWIGLVFAALFLAIAVRLRRYREPI
jgi:ABC-2 type transport system permease protein